MVRSLKAGVLVFTLLLVCRCVFAGDPAFARLLAQAREAEKCGNLAEAMTNCDLAGRLAVGGSNLCLLSHCYCDLAFLTHSKTLQKLLVTQATACAKKAVADAPQNATAHASLAVCYAKECAFGDIRTELEDSRLLRDEAEKAIALDPKQDIAYYLLGRWNYGIANAGWLARTYIKIVYGALPEASFQAAIRDFKQACALAPDRILNRTGLAMAYAAVGEKALEIAELKEACGLKPLGPEDQQALKDARRKLSNLQP